MTSSRKRLQKQTSQRLQPLASLCGIAGTLFAQTDIPGSATGAGIREIEKSVGYDDALGLTTGLLVPS